MAPDQATAQAPPIRRLQPILPGPRPSVPPQTDAPTSRRREVVSAACGNCRRRKVKCDGQRPACGRCNDRKFDCEYSRDATETSSQALKRKVDELEHHKTAYESIYELLQSVSAKEALEIHKRIKTYRDAEEVLRHVKDGNLLLQMTLVPETRFRYVFPYRSEMPEDHIPNNPYLGSLIYKAASLYSTDQCSTPSAPNNSTLLADLGSSDYQSLYLKPFHAAQVVDPLLSDVRISLWTAVCDDDMLMRDLLGVFFRCEYHFTAAFQKDCFLENMAAGREDFCSPLLVNVVLAYACVCYPGFSNRAEYWNPQTLHYRFLAEAKRLWELEATKARITTIQAGIIFNVIHNLSGLDEIGQAYRIQAIALAHRIRLFDNTADGQSDRIQNGRAFAAWALYSWETLVGFSFMICPLLKKPPDLPLPDPSEDVQWYGEVWLKYPIANSLVPSYFGWVFRARCQFRVIMNEFCHLAYSNGSSVTFNKAIELHSQLRDWYDNLPVKLLPKSIVLPGHLQLHMYYHHLLLTIYGPLLDIEPKEETSPRQIVADATKHLQTLVRLYYLRHGFEAMDLFIVIPCMLIAYECINIIGVQTPVNKLEDLRSTLILVTKCLYEQRRNHYLAMALFRVILGRMDPGELALLKDTMKLGEEDTAARQNMEQAVRSHWPVSVVKRKEDMDAHILANLVDEYACLNIE